MKKRGVFNAAKSPTTGNGCEFLDDALIGKTVGCGVYCTRAYASREKGPAENYNTHR